jgi:hypothetical protein
MTQEDQSFPLDRSSGWKMTHQAGSDHIASPETSGSLLVRCISPYPHPACAPASMVSATATAWSRARLLTATVPQPGCYELVCSGHKIDSGTPETS